MNFKESLTALCNTISEESRNMESLNSVEIGSVSHEANSLNSESYSDDSCSSVVSKIPVKNISNLCTDISENLNDVVKNFNCTASDHCIDITKNDDSETPDVKTKDPGCLIHRDLQLTTDGQVQSLNVNTTRLRSWNQNISNDLAYQDASNATNLRPGESHSLRTLQNIVNDSAYQDACNATNLQHEEINSLRTLQSITNQNITNYSAYKDACNITNLRPNESYPLKMFQNIEKDSAYREACNTTDLRPDENHPLKTLHNITDDSTHQNACNATHLRPEESNLRLPAYKSDECKRNNNMLVSSQCDTFPTHVANGEPNTADKHSEDLNGCTRREINSERNLDNNNISNPLNSQGITCELCSINFSSETNLQIHEAIHHKKKQSRICCGFKFLHIKPFCEHQLTYHTQPSSLPFKCCLCRVSFKLLKDITIHKTRKHGATKCLATCVTCRENFRRHYSIFRQCFFTFNGIQTK